MAAQVLFGGVALIGIGVIAYRTLKARREKQKTLIKRILIVITSNDKMGSTDKKTGFWLEELAAPYNVFKDAGFDVVLASPKGGKPPIDKISEESSNLTSHTSRFTSDGEAKRALETTKKLTEVDESHFGAIYFPGGHGPLWDLPDDPICFRLIERFAAAEKPIAAVCHGPAVFKQTPSIVKGHNVTGFSDTEEVEVKLDTVVPFSLETMLKKHGAKYSKAGVWKPHVVTGNNSLIITGQNPASSEGVAQALVKKLTMAVP